MKIIYNNYIPFKGFKAMNLFGFLFVRNGFTLNDVDIRHETIHTKQMREMLYIPFYIWYLLEWLIRLLFCRNTKKAYKNIAFEQEAYGNQYNTTYLENRKIWAWFKYLL